MKQVDAADYGVGVVGAGAMGQGMGQGAVQGGRRGGAGRASANRPGGGRRRAPVSAAAMGTRVFRFGFHAKYRRAAGDAPYVSTST